MIDDSFIWLFVFLLFISTGAGNERTRTSASVLIHSIKTRSQMNESLKPNKLNWLMIRSIDFLSFYSLEALVQGTNERVEWTRTSASVLIDSRTTESDELCVPTVTWLHHTTLSWIHTAKSVISPTSVHRFLSRVIFLFCETVFVVFFSLQKFLTHTHTHALYGYKGQD